MVCGREARLDVEFLIQRAGGCERDLLLENDVDERGEAGLADPERRDAVFFNDASEVGVAFGEFADGFGEKFFGYVNEWNGSCRADLLRR